MEGKEENDSGQEVLNMEQNSEEMVANQAMIKKSRDQLG